MTSDIVYNEPQKEFDQWFGQLIHQIKTHKLMLETGTASKKLESFYESMMKGDEIKVINTSRQESSKYFIKKVIEMYIGELNNTPIHIEKLAFSTSDERILVWVQIPDEDEQSETQLILAQAKVNAQFHKYGFHVESMIVENSDALDIPPQYLAVKE